MSLGGGELAGRGGSVGSFGHQGVARIDATQREGGGVDVKREGEGGANGWPRSRGAGGAATCEERRQAVKKANRAWRRRGASCGGGARGHGCCCISGRDGIPLPFCKGPGMSNVVLSVSSETLEARVG